MRRSCVMMVRSRYLAVEMIIRSAGSRGGEPGSAQLSASISAVSSALVSPPNSTARRNQRAGDICRRNLFFGYKVTKLPSRDGRDVDRTMAPCGGVQRGYRPVGQRMVPGHPKQSAGIKQIVAHRETTSRDPPHSRSEGSVRSTPSSRLPIPFMQPNTGWRRAG